MTTLFSLAPMIEILGLALIVAALLAPPAYFFLAGLDLREGLAHLRAKQPWLCPVARGVAYLILGLAAFAH